jgi:nitroreductase
MNVMEAIKTRYSLRNYQNKPVEQEKLDAILEAARIAPSARNVQEWRFIVVRDENTRKALSKAAKNQVFVAEAPVVIACCAVKTDYIMTCGQLAYPIDLAIAIDHMVLKAIEEGLGACWIGAFYEDQVKDILKIPKEVRVVQMLILGYPSKPGSGKKDRLSIQEIVKYETW